MVWYVLCFLFLIVAEGRRLVSDPTCGDDLCRSIDPASWCREDNGVCQSHNTPCACSGPTPTPSGPTPTPSPPGPASGDEVEAKYRAVSKALYVWNPGDLVKKWWDWKEHDIKLLTSFCVTHNFTRAIVFIGSVEWEWETFFKQKRLPHDDTFAELFQALWRAGVVPYVAFYLNDDPNNLQGGAKAADVVSAVDAFNRKYPHCPIAGIDGDQEPTQITVEYQEMNAQLLARRDELGAQLFIAAALKPGWLNKQYKWAPMAEAALENLDEGMIMAYVSKPEISMKLGDKALAQAAEQVKTMSIAVEVSPRAPESDTFWSMVSGPDKLNFFKMVVEMDAHYRTGDNALTYHDFVIHDYEGLFKALYGVAANAYQADSVTKLYK